MGYELNKLLQQYGVSTPSMSNYAGTAIPTQVTAPVTPTFYNTKGDKVDLQFRGSATGGLIPVDTLLSTNAVTPVSGNWKFANNDNISAANKVALDKYNTAWNTYYGGNDAQRNADYQEQLRKYNLDIADYNKYKQDYQSRLASTPMYSGSQFQTTPNATQNTYATPIAAPTYGSIPLSYGSMTPEQQSAYYNAQREKGYTAADLSNAYNTALGTSPTNSSTLSDLENKYPNRLDTWMPNTAYDTSNVPTNFNWQEYINANPDLGAAGIDTEKEAQRHYVLYGANENRQGYGDGGLVESQSVDPITLRYYNPQPDPLAPIKPEVSAGDINPITLRYYNPQPDPMAEVPMEISAEKIVPNVQMYDDYPNLSDMLSSKAQIPAMYQLDENGQPVISQEPVASQVPEQTDLGKLSAKYSEMSPYAAQIAESRKIAKAESDAFTKMIQGQLTSPEQNNLSKAEMYFRLAAAFGSPTRTKQGFMENLGAAGQQLAEYSKGARSDEAAKNALRLEAQKLRMQTAKEDLTTLRTLAAEEMKDKRALELERLKEEIKAGQPLSAEGKQAYDILRGTGVKYGSTDFSNQVKNLIDDKNAARAASIAIQEGNLNINKQKFEKEAKQLSSKELELKNTAEAFVNSSQDALGQLNRALDLNTRARETSGVFGTKNKLASWSNANDQTTLDTNELINILKSKTYANLKTTFGSQLSDGERKALESINGIEAKSREERERILINAAAALRTALNRSKKQLESISSGSYGEKKR